MIDMKLLPMIDFCVSVQGPAAPDLMRLFLGSLVHHCRTDGVKFHFVNRDSSKWSVGNPYLSKLDHSMHSLPIKYEGQGVMGLDVNYCADWMVDHIGLKKWVCISHFDMWFKKDWLTYARSYIADDVALVGVHCPIMLVNRKAYAQSVVKFSTMGGYRAVPISDGSGEYKVRHQADPRCVGGLLIRGFDTGEFMELEMRAVGWKVHPLNVFNEEEPTEEGHAWFHHIGGGATSTEKDIVAKLGLCHEVMGQQGY